MRVEAPWLKTVILDDKDDGNYVIVNQVFANRMCLKKGSVYLVTFVFMYIVHKYERIPQGPFTDIHERYLVTVAIKTP